VKEPPLWLQSGDPLDLFSSFFLRVENFGRDLELLLGRRRKHRVHPPLATVYRVSIENEVEAVWAGVHIVQLTHEVDQPVVGFQLLNHVRNSSVLGLHLWLHFLRFQQKVQPSQSVARQIQQCSSLPPCWGVLSFRSEAPERPDSETARLHHAAQQRGGGVAARGARSRWRGAGSPATADVWLSAFMSRLRELGWIEGRNINIDVRWAEGRNDRSAEIAAEFVRLKVDVIVTYSSEHTQIATSTIPIVFALASDPQENSLPPEKL
jgi:hypothetical protein